MCKLKSNPAFSYSKAVRKNNFSVIIVICVCVLVYLFSGNLYAQKITFKASKRTIDAGETTILSWHYRSLGRKDSIYISGIDGVWQRKGEVEVSPTKDTKYTLNIKHRNEIITKNIKIKVRKPEIIYFSGPESMESTSNCVLTWKTRFAEKIEIVNEASFLAETGSIVLTPTGPTKYTLKVCNKYNYCDSATFNVSISGDYVKSPPSLRQGESGLLEWRFINASKVSLIGVDSLLPAEGTKKISPGTTTEYKFVVNKKTDEEKDTIIIKTVKVPVVRSNYITGEKSYVTLPSGKKLIFDIFAVNWRNFPDEIRLKIMVTDTSGNYITGLAPPFITEKESRNFFKTIIETVEDKRYPINDFTINEIRNMTSTPHDISLVLDYSGSMDSYFNNLDKATQNFIKKKNIEDRLGIVRFDDSIGVETPLVKNSTELMNKMTFNKGEDYGGSTALYSASDAGLRLLDDTNRSKQLILMTDGFENSSMFYWGTYFTFASEVLNSARKNHVAITTIDFMGYANSPLLEALADMSGGKYYQLKNDKEIDKVFAELQHLYHNYYEIVYKPATQSGNRIIDLVYNDNTDHYTTARAVAYINDSTNIETVENEGITTNTATAVYNGQAAITRQTVALFEFNKSDLDETAKRKLDRIVSYMKANPNYKIIIQGHSDLKGDDTYCIKISAARASEVFKYLRKKGISSSRLKNESKGKTAPVWTVEDQEWKARENRRVDIEFVKK